MTEYEEIFTAADYEFYNDPEMMEIVKLEREVPKTEYEEK